MPKGMGYKNSGNKATNPAGPDKDLSKQSGAKSASTGGGNPTTNPTGPDRPLPKMAVNVTSGKDSYGITNPSSPDRPLPKVG